MEEKKNNKGLIIGVIIFLFICLIAIIFYMFKMTYVGNKTNDNTNTTDTEETTDEGFTELTKYELQEGEEKEISVDNKTIKLSKKENICFINDKEIENCGIYVTNKFIISSNGAQYGEMYNIYDFEGNIKYKGIEDKSQEENKTQMENLRIYDKRLLFDSAIILNGDNFIDNFKIGNLKYVNCKNLTSKDINDYKETLLEHENDQLKYELVYEIKYLNNKVTIEKEDQIKTVGEWIKTFDKFCVN